MHGSNEEWHIDGFKKLKLFVFSTNGCIEGFRRDNSDLQRH